MQLSRTRSCMPISTGKVHRKCAKAATNRFMLSMVIRRRRTKVLTEQDIIQAYERHPEIKVEGGYWYKDGAACGIGILAIDKGIAPSAIDYAILGAYHYGDKDLFEDAR